MIVSNHRTEIRTTVQVIALAFVSEVYIRESLNGKKTFSFGDCPNEGGGGLPMPEFFGPLSRSSFLVNKKSLFLQICQCIELLNVF